MGISILIVDDDKLLVNKLEETVRWEKLGISMVFTAYNIRQAQALLKDYPIEILLCDIDMPQGNGLELLEWARIRELDMECVFLSSYANFSYAQMALKLSSREYLLKPISNADLEHVLAKVVEEVSRKQSASGKIPDNTKEKFWNDILAVRVGEEKRVADAIAAGRYREDDRVTLEILRTWSNPSGDNYKKDIALFDFIVRNITMEFFQNNGEKLEAVVRLSDLEWMLVFRCESDETSLEVCTRGLKLYLDEGIFSQSCIYVGKSGRFAEIIALRDRLERLEKDAVPGEDGLLFEKDWSCPAGEYPMPPWNAWEKEILRVGMLEQTKVHIFQYIDEIQRKNGWKREYLSRFVWEFSRLFYRYLNAQNLEFAQMFEAGEFERQEQIAGTSLANLKENIRYLFERLEGHQKNKSHQDHMVSQLKEYIEEHLNEDLSRSVLAKEVYLSEDYISKVFAKATGTSLPNYIAARRVEKAKEYLAGSSLPVSKIALEVGYSNFSYFSKTFKDLVGCTPNEFRSRMK